MRMSFKRLLLAATLTLSAIGTANAAKVLIDTDDQSGVTYVGMTATNMGGYFYNWDGLSGRKGDHVPDANFITENMNIYYVFDLSAITSAGIDLNNVSKATLSLSAGTSYTPIDGFVWSIYDVSTSVSELTAPQQDRTDIFEDLQSGANFGSMKLPYNSEIHIPYEISFNQVGLSSIKSASGLFAIGGSFNQWLDGEYDTANLFPNDGGWALYLQFATPVPEAETYSMLLAGLGFIAAIVRRHKAKTGCS
ncbi:PEP-CTERM sorting domain-containing protein [Methylophilus luteus]|uniref:PEP-CTERM sorting domain-containing protein n=1 Tax=Methylophilus luteus TaxID=640108 RepID=A0ABW3F616_9PROT